MSKQPSILTTIILIALAATTGIVAGIILQTYQQNFNYTVNDTVKVLGLNFNLTGLDVNGSYILKINESDGYIIKTFQTGNLTLSLTTIDTGVSDTFTIEVYNTTDILLGQFNMTTPSYTLTSLEPTELYYIFNFHVQPTVNDGTSGTVQIAVTYTKQ